MAIKVLMPALSPTMEEGTLSKWLKKEGDVVKSGDILAEVETDKATMEYECTEEGVLGKILVAEGSEGVKVNSVIAVLLEDGEGQDAIESIISANTSASVEQNKPTKEVKQEASVSVKNEIISNEKISSNNISSSKKIFITPLAKRIAQQNNITITSLQGTGPNGRITKVDVEKAIENPTVSANDNNISSTISGLKSGYEDKPNSGMRKTIAKRLLESKTTVPHYYLTIECNVDQILKARVSLNALANEQYKLSVNDFIIKATALAMQEVKEANSSWMGDVTRYYNASDVAIAVATPTGLFTPIIKNAESKGLVAISNEMKELAKKAREGKLKPEEYQGGGFSISNLGMFGIKNFSPIVNPPHSGILGIGATEKKPIVVNDTIVIANIMSVTMSADHRVLDGAVGAKFLNAFKKYIENPMAIIL